MLFKNLLLDTKVGHNLTADEKTGLTDSMDQDEMHQSSG